MTSATNDESLRRVSQWCYEGVWSVLTNWLLVPREPPTLPLREGEVVKAWRPSTAFLSYLKFEFWVFYLFVGTLMLGILFGVAIAFPIAAIILTPFAIGIVVVPAVFSLLALYLKYDTTWYVLSERSMRIRRGIWIIKETTLTFENIQNVHLSQGPLQRFFGFSNLLVETAGGGVVAGAGHGTGHQGLLEGLSNASDVRDLLMSRVKQSKSAGLGDELHANPGSDKPQGFTPQQIELLAEIRELTRRMAIAS